MLFDRNQLLPVIADKLAVRQFVAERIGPETIKEVYQVYDSESEIQLADLPTRFVLKANNGSGFNHFVRTRADRDLKTIAAVARKWLATDYGAKNGEWCYKSIQPKVFAEQYFETEPSEYAEYCFFCFDGMPKYIETQLGHGNYGVARGVFDLEWNYMDVSGEGHPKYSPDIFLHPECLDEMIDIAKTLSAGFDFIRIDLFWAQNKIGFEEMTNYPAAGFTIFSPREYDQIFGSYWLLDTMTYLPKTRAQAFSALFRSQL